MDHLQNHTGSKSEQSAAPETLNHKLNDEEALNDVSGEAELDWSQFIQQELERLRNLEKGEAKLQSNEADLATPPASLDEALSRFIEKIPVERMVDSAMRFLLKQSEPVPERRPRKRRRRRY